MSKGKFNLALIKENNEYSVKLYKNEFEISGIIDSIDFEEFGFKAPKYTKDQIKVENDGQDELTRDQKYIISKFAQDDGVKPKLQEWLARKDVVEFAKKNGGIEFYYKDNQDKTEQAKLPVYYEANRFGAIAAIVGVCGVFQPAAIASFALTVVSAIPASREWLVSNILKAFVADDKIIADVMQYMLANSDKIRPVAGLVGIVLTFVTQAISSLGFFGPSAYSFDKNMKEVNAIPKDHPQKDVFTKGDRPFCKKIIHTEVSNNKGNSL
jgi:hypothetical protein